MLALLVLQAIVQGPVPVSGRVVRVAGRDTVPVSGTMVILHRVRTDRQGPIDSTTSRAAGQFDFSIRPDSGAVYLMSARWDGIEYFATPLVLDGKPRAPVTVVVSDTSSAAPVQLVARHLIVSAPSQDGIRTVIDLLVLENRGTATRVAAAPSRPTWAMHLSPGAANVHLGDTDFSNESLALRGDTLDVFAAIPPGQRDLTLQYEIPPKLTEFEIPVEADVLAANLLAEEDGVTVAGGLTRNDSAVVDNGRHFTRWTGVLTAGRNIVLHLPRTGVPGWILPALIAVFGLGVLGLTVIASRKVLPR